MKKKYFSKFDIILLVLSIICQMMYKIKKNIIMLMRIWFHIWELIFDKFLHV